MAVPLSDEVRALVDGRNYATLATLDPDGGPQTRVLYRASEFALPGA
ncbi:pyridoxamine 5'-phosphate oxidase family protein [Amycolatopsis sp. CA-230715]|nr:pyridoxamine 5'-phosphate oxidase family protein [Amycolatopsis sp. CA-230715]